MLKRAISILLIPVLLVCTTGGVIYVEHCGMTKDPSYSLSEGQKCCCSKDVHERCCNQTKIVIKKTADHFSSSSVVSVSMANFLFFAVSPARVQMHTFESCANIYAQDHAPPDISVPFPILFRSLLI